MSLPVEIPILINRGSGYLAEQKSSGIQPLKQAFREAGIKSEPRLLDPEELSDALREAVQAGTELVIVGGGDGTIAMATNLLMGSDTAMAILPMGTMNFLARDLNLPLDPVQAFHSLEEGKVEAVDVGSLNGEVFLCAAILGFFPAAAARAKDYHGRNPLVKAVQTAWIFLTGFVRSRPLELHFCVGDEHRDVRTRLVIIANNPFAATAEIIPKKANLHKGRLAVYVSRHSGLWSMFKGALLFMIGKYHADREMEIVEADSLDIHRGHRHHLRVMLDGEHREFETPLELELLPAKLKVLYSCEAHQNESS